jgi:acetolactate synthase-1/2/3 large subunit
MDHALMLGADDLSRADVVLVLEADVPWMPGETAPGPDAWIAAVAQDPIKRKIPTYEFTADLRLTADPLLAIRAIEEAVIALIGPPEARVFEARARSTAEVTRARRAQLAADAQALASKSPIDPLWLSYTIGKIAGPEAIVIDDTLPHNRVHEYLHCNRPGSYFFTPGTSGGWATGAAFGAKLAAPERDVIAVTGDGFYMFGTPAAALWSAAHYKAPFLTVVYQNRSYATGTVRMNKLYPDGYAEKGGFEGGYFDPPMDHAKEAEAAGAYGINVRDPAELEAALQAALGEVRKGRPAVVAVWLARHLRSD